MEIEILKATINNLTEVLSTVNQIDVNSPDAEDKIKRLKIIVSDVDCILEKLKS